MPERLGFSPFNFDKADGVFFEGDQVDFFAAEMNIPRQDFIAVGNEEIFRLFFVAVAESAAVFKRSGGQDYFRISSTGRKVRRWISVGPLVRSSFKCWGVG